VRKSIKIRGRGTGERMKTEKCKVEENNRKRDLAVWNIQNMIALVQHPTVCSG